MEGILSSSPIPYLPATYTPRNTPLRSSGTQIEVTYAVLFLII